MRRSKAVLVTLVLVHAAGLALRFSGLQFGLPLHSNFYIRPDESLIVVAAAQFWERQGDPGFFAYPALMVELCALLYRALPSEFGSDPSAYFLTARALSAICGTLTIGVIWAITQRLTSERGALLAAGLFAFAPLSVRDAHFGVTDTLLTLLLALAGLATIRYLQSPPARERRELAVAACSFGLALSTKYTALLALPVLVAAVAWKRRAELRRGLSDLTLLAAVPAVLFTLLNPYVFLRWRESVGTAYWILSVFYVPHSGDIVWSAAGAWRQVWMPLIRGPGGIAGLAAAALAIFLLPRRAPITLAVLFPLIFVAALLPFQHAVPYRYLLPALPWVAVLAACAADQATRRIRWAGAFPCAVLALTLPPALDCVRSDALLATEDTRTLAGRWLARKVSPATPIVVLGGPESEPQITEAAASIERRIQYVYRLYGPQSGDIVSQLYRLQLRTAPQGGFDVRRNPAPAEIDSPEILVVVPSYPLPMVNSAPVAPAAFGAQRRLVARFEGLQGGAGAPVLDRGDAFFLPFTDFGRVQRPGPNLELWLVRRD